MRTALITGAASGFGRATAELLLSAGWRVVGFDEAPLAGESWPQGPVGLEVRHGDVRSDADVAALAAAVGDVDLLVNNAGYAVFGTQEEVPLPLVRDLFDVNVLGPARLTRAFLPGLRRRRGVVVQLSSVAGRTVFPESGFYAATKHALEAMSEALAQEVASFGVRVRVVEPGAFATGFGDRAARSSPSPTPDSPYASVRPGWTARKSEVLEPPQPPAWVAEAIVGSLADPEPFRRVVVGSDARRILALRDALGPDAWTRLAIDRQGHDAPHEPGFVPSPAELLALPDDHPDLARAALADAAGHLGHWALTPPGRQALERLRTASPSTPSSAAPSPSAPSGPPERE
jgi:NAD(P)-dependent dehydrogenase (short-subunit alcohol dehydrogenase family)